MNRVANFLHVRTDYFLSLILCLFLFSTLFIIAGCKVENGKKSPDTVITKPGNPMKYPWPMARSDIANTGATSSTLSGQPSEKWSVSLGPLAGVSPVVEYGYIYHVDSETGPHAHILQCRDLQTGEEVWSVRYPSVLPNLALSVADGKVIVKASGFGLAAYDAFSGEQLWYTQLSNARGDVYSPAVIDNDAVYISFIGSSEPQAKPGSVARYNLETGELVWETILDDYPVGADDGMVRAHTNRIPVIDAERVYLSLFVFDSEDFGRGNVIALEKKTGIVNWSTSFTHESKMDSLMDFDAPVISEHGLYVTYYLYTAMGNTILYVRCYDKEDGTDIWTYASETAFWPGKSHTYLEGNTTFANDRLHLLYSLTTYKQIQILDLGGATGGSFRLGDGTMWTDDIAFNAGASTIREELEAIYDKGEVEVLIYRDYIIALGNGFDVRELQADFSGLAGAEGPKLLYKDKMVEYMVKTLDSLSGSELSTNSVITPSKSYLGLFIQASNIHLMVMKDNGIPILAGFDAHTGNRMWFVALDQSGDTAWGPIGAVADGRIVLLIDSTNGWVLYCIE